MKDVRLEFRTRYAVNTLLLFAASALLVVSFSLGTETLGPSMRAIVLWIVILFSAVAGLAHTFVSEEERGTMLLLQLNAMPSTVIAGKLLFNTLLSVAMNAVVAIVFAVVIGFADASFLAVFTILGLGAFGMSGAMTLNAAIIARAPNKGPLFAVLSFPVLVPLLLSVVGGTKAALTGASVADLLTEVAALIGYAGVVITASVLLFDYLWKD